MVFICLCLCLSLSIFFLATTESSISKPTPLYGQPSWWGEDEDPANKKQTRGGTQPGQDSPGRNFALEMLLHIYLILFITHDCYDMPLYGVAMCSSLGHWEMDGVNPEAGLWLPVEDRWPDYNMPRHWAVHVCLVMDYHPLSCRTGERKADCTSHVAQTETDYSYLPKVATSLWWHLDY